MLRVSISTWSLHNALGQAWYEPHGEGKTLVNKSALSPQLDLLDVPAEIVSHGINTLEICHFHIPSLEDSYLSELRSAIEDAGVELYSLLMDSGDISNPDLQRRREDMALIKHWIETAAKLGASCVRIDAGLSQPTPETIRLAAEAFTELADYAAEWGVKPATENWHAMSRNPDHLLQILELCGREYGLCVDFGNARGPHKYAWLARLLPHGTSIHAWGEYDEDGTFDAKDFRHCLQLAVDSGFAGPVTLLYNRTPDIWRGIDELRREVEVISEQ
jgi:hypothetical protein